MLRIEVIGWLAFDHQTTYTQRKLNLLLEDVQLHAVQTAKVLAASSVESGHHLNF